MNNPDSINGKASRPCFWKTVLFSFILIFVVLLLYRTIRVNGFKPKSDNQGKLPLYSVADIEYEIFLNYDGSIAAFCCPEKGKADSDGDRTYNVFVLNRKTNKIKKISVSCDGSDANGDSFSCVVSGDGRYVAYESEASNIVPGDDNGVSDIFLYDGLTGKTRIISTDSAGNQSNGSSGCPSISGDGSLVSFSSKGDNLVEGDTNRLKDIFVKNTVNGYIERISVSKNKEQAEFNEAYNASDDSSISSDGRFVVFSSPASNLTEGDTNNLPDVFLKDRKTGSITMVSLDSSGRKADNFSQSPTVSRNGNRVVFDSLASNLTPVNNNGIFNVFIRDVSSKKTIMASLSPTGEPGNGESQCPHMSWDGNLVVYSSLASNLADSRHKGLQIIAYDVNKRKNFIVSDVPDNLKIEEPYFGNPHISGDGRFVGYYCTEGSPIDNPDIPFHIFITDIINKKTVSIY